MEAPTYVMTDFREHSKAHQLNRIEIAGFCSTDELVKILKKRLEDRHTEFGYRRDAAADQVNATSNQMRQVLENLRALDNITD